jgi:transposase
MTTASQTSQTKKDNNEKYFVGIDVAKDELVVHLLPTNEKLAVPNSSNGIKQLVTRLKEIQPKQIVMEATGGLERELLINLIAAGLPATAMNPRQARNLAKGLGTLAKTDAIDALLLARFAQLECLPIRPVPSEEIRNMNDLVTRRQQLIEMRTMETNRSHRATQKPVQKSIKKMIELLNKQIDDIDGRIQAMIDANPDWSEKDKILQSVPGVGSTTSRVLISALPELGSLNRQEIAALAGVAPVCDDSGGRSAARHIKGGRADVRAALYMATFNAIHRNATFKNFFERLRAAGKAYKVALVATMRKMITILNVMIRTKTCWKEQRVLSQNV